MLVADFPSSFEQVVRQREKQVLRVAYRMLGNWADAEDAAQEVFVRLHRHGLGFPNEAALGTWIYLVTANLCIDWRRPARAVDPLPELRSLESSAEAAAIREQEKARLMAALAKLGPKERAAVVLREIEGLDTREVAEALGSTESTVRSQISKAMDRLRVILEEQ